MGQPYSSYSISTGIARLFLGVWIRAVASYKRRFYIDHDHLSGEVRGLLCGACNMGIGQLKDDPALLRAAATYIEQNRLKVVGGRG